MDIVNKRTEDLIPYINNPRNNDGAVDKVASSIKNFGFKVPIVIDSKNEIVTGHTRLKAAKKLGIEEVPCIIADDLSETQIKAFRIADNKVAEYAEWDEDLLNIELSELEELDFDLDDTGFDTKELDRIMQPDEVVEDVFDEEPPENPISKRGDIWLLGRHRVMCGDSTSDDVAVLMDGMQADLLITDPPYNVAYEGKTKDALTIENDSMADDKFREFLRDAFQQAVDVMKAGASFYIWHADSEGYNFRGACLDVDLQVRQCLIWNKNSMVMGRQDYHWKHEPCLYGWKSGASHLWAADRKQTTILNFDRPSRSSDHPTMKPVKLFDYLIKNNTKGGDIALDLFSGSGTTFVACEQNGRTAYGMELDEKYVDVIVNRYITFKESIQDVFLLRGGEKISYEQLQKQ